MSLHIPGVHFVNRKHLTVAVCTALVGMAAPAYAQEQAASNSGEAITKIETVTVTGSRISNPNVVSAQPVSVLTAEDIKATGAVNIGDVLTTMPALATSFTMGNSGRFIGTAGISMQDLRNLGTQRTLVLVNGRRMVGAMAGDTAVDTNLIPADWIERVEIITGGASAVYGADAVSGVINFILKKKYEGVNLHAQYGSSQHGSFGKSLFAVTAGTNFADDRGNIAASLEHARQDALEFRDRFGNEDLVTINTPGGKYARSYFKNGGSYEFTTGGVFSRTGSFSNPANLYVFNPDGTYRPLRIDGLRDTGRRRCTDCDHNDSNRANQLQPKYDRTTFNTAGSFDINENHRLYMEGLYNQANSKSLGTAAFNTFGTYGGHFIDPDNAYVSPALNALTGGQGFVVSRDDFDSGRRGEDTKRKTMRLVLGAEGVLGSKGDWQYDASVNYGRTHETRENFNNRYMERFYAGLDAVDNGSGKIVCRSQVDPTSVNSNLGTTISAETAASCIPFKIFGDGAISQAARDWFNVTTKSKTRLSQFVAGGSLVNNNLFELPAGPVSLATGLEYRRETSEQINDPLDKAGLTFLNAIPDSRGSYNVRELWIETAVPLLHDLPLIKNMTLGGAVRFSDYDTIGNTRAWRYNLDWAINDSLRLRGNSSSAVRAPNIGELFGGQSQNFMIMDDPCDAQQIGRGKDPAVRRANCAALGLPANFTDQVTGSNEGLSGSNPDLEPETGKTWTYGFVFTPTFLEGFSLNVDYWKIKLRNAISSLDFEQMAQRCVDNVGGINNTYCANVQRRADGQISFVTATLQNIAARETDGIDIGASYSHEFYGGKMSWQLDATRTLNYTDYPFQTSPDEKVEYLGALGYPKWKAVASVNYKRDNWDASWSTRFVSGVARQTDWDTYKADPLFLAPAKAGSGTVHDVRVSYDFADTGWNVYGGITNLFDSDPPLAMYGNTFGSGVYDTIGRAYYLGVNYKFR
ncbi:TonB-dependent outer membrane receptor precursor [Lysobacter enzymogenes]|uniref:TonB-dependent outer membrane receptor n=2 Tax=Bacteria TaxID=2 RepID=A0AAU9AG24_LYSEN|nr:TonB-dependent outer membrane receptor precursor [Lysobacter enzymogenes]